jgi:hypothetical protein
MQIRDLQSHEELLDGRRWTARIVNGDISHYVEKRHGSWEEIIESGKNRQRKFLNYEVAKELQRRVRQLEKKEEKS